MTMTRSLKFSFPPAWGKVRMGGLALLFVAGAISSTPRPAQAQQNAPQISTTSTGASANKANMTLAPAPIAGNANKANIPQEIAHRTIAVRSTIENIGVNAGLVIAYGHPIKPPYYIEYRGSLLLVNGIQVEPSLTAQREYGGSRQMTADEKDTFGQLQELTANVRTYYADHKDKESNSDLHEQILAMVRAHPKVKDAKWFNDKVLFYYPKGPFENVAQSIDFSMRMHPTRPKPSQEKLKEDQVAQLERHLKNGGCIFWDTASTWQNSAATCASVKESVQYVMSQPSLSDSEREMRLRSIFGGRSDPALDIIANYKPSEWK